MHGGAAGGAGIFHPRRALEAQIGRGLQHLQRGGETPAAEKPALGMVAEHDLVDVLGGETRIGQRFARNFDDAGFRQFRRQVCRTAYAPIPQCRPS